MVDVWSRKITGWAVHREESSEHASDLLQETCVREEIDRDSLVLHSDNGSPMKGATLLATLQNLGVVPSFSRPRVSDDNPYSGALFRTLEYRPEFPVDPFASLETAREWAAWFVQWYNTEHLHSGIRYVTPEQRHTGEHLDILADRHALYQKARRRHPERWSRNTRNWSPIIEVCLNPQPHRADKEAA